MNKGEYSNVRVTILGNAGKEIPGDLLRVKICGHHTGKPQRFSALIRPFSPLVPGYKPWEHRLHSFRSELPSLWATWILLGPFSHSSQGLSRELSELMKAV